MCETDSEALEIITQDLKSHAAFWKSLHDQVRFLKAKKVYRPVPDEVLDPEGMEVMIHEYDPIINLGGPERFSSIPNLSHREMEAGALFSFQVTELQENFEKLRRTEAFLKCFLVGTGAHWDCLVVNKKSSKETEIIYTSTFNFKNLSMTPGDMERFAREYVNARIPQLREGIKRKKAYKNCTDDEIEEILREGRPHPHKVHSIEENIEWYTHVHKDTIHVFECIAGCLTGTRTVQALYLKAFMEGLVIAFTQENLHKLYVKKHKQLKNAEKLEEESKTLSLAKRASYVGLEVYVMKQGEFCHPVAVRDALLEPLREFGTAHVSRETAQMFVNWIHRLQDEYSGSELSEDMKSNRNLVWLMNILAEVEAELAVVLS
eukprot:TRINITY_DN11981_c0_g1_i1.p1 TRINITY_DN11981_c0_g1~~TRINITY_DN11981_c0_g1_i1.p1  ORF type:complete len:399 (-),score=104.36 TRINITY_DN11981_c0_g1_i1:8-1135(-)